MRSIQSFVAAICISLLLSPGFAQTRVPQISDSENGINGVRKYFPPVVGPIYPSNSARIDSLIRGGNLYLSLQDAIALALENNLDIEISRYGPLEAKQDLKRAEAGGALRGVNQGVANGPSSAAPIALNAFSTGVNAAGSGTGSTASVNGVISQLGPTIPNYDPVLTSTLSYNRNTALQTSGFLNGQEIVLGRSSTYNFGLTQGFQTGGQATLTFNNAVTYQNTGRLDINPYTSGNLGLLVTQPLLQGFGFAVNRRLIVQAKNSVQIQDFVFKQQVQTTVASVINLYWDLVAFNEQVKVAQQALAASERLHANNKTQVEVGTLAPIAIVQAEAEVATNQQQLVQAQTQVLEQETILKNAITRQGVTDPQLAQARIIPLDSIRVPDVEQVQPVQDLVAAALQARPEISVDQLNIQNTKMTILGDRNSLLPTVSAFANVSNGALVGPVNTIALPGTTTTGLVSSGASLNPFVGGIGSYFTQLFGHSYPNYSIGLQMNIPVRNRAAQSDYVRDTLTLRQNQLTLQKQTNQIRVDVQNAVIALQQARAQYQAAVKGRILEEQTLDAEQKKYALGASTIYNVILIQRDLSTAQGNEVLAEDTYVKARNNLDFVTGRILDANNVDLSEAIKGVVSHPPTPIPATVDQNGQASVRPGSVIPSVQAAAPTTPAVNH